MRGLIGAAHLGESGLLREIGLKVSKDKVNCNEHIQLFWIMPFLSHPWHQTQVIEGFVGG